MKIQIPDDFDPEKSYGADNVFVPPHSPTVPSISSQGKHVVSVPAWNGYLGSGLHPLRMEAGVGSLF